MIIAIDFDGTLHDGQWPGIGQPAFSAVEVMNLLKSKGHYLIIWTCRSGERLTEAVNWLLEKGIPFDRINDHEPEHLKEFDNSNARKVYAHLYIDDKQVGGLPPWMEIYDYACKLEADYRAGQLKSQSNDIKSNGKQ